MTHAWNTLTPAEAHIIEQAGTEKPFSGEYDAHYANGLYLCRRCNAPLYRSLDKFKSGCGWPSFDDELPGAVKRLPDPDGRRVEIRCQACDGHLGHVFSGEHHTDKNLRHCVNSLSIRFVTIEQLFEKIEHNKLPFDYVIVAGGCFWGVEYFFEQEPGVIATSVGYIGGHVDNPAYQQVCTGDTGHVEAVAVFFDPKHTSVEKLYALFFDIHDATQKDGQGPDIGPQYHSAIFYRNDSQKQAAQKAMQNIPHCATLLHPMQKFWPAEEYHQHYFSYRKKPPTCHYRRSKK